MNVIGVDKRQNPTKVTMSINYKDDASGTRPECNLRYDTLIADRFTNIMPEINLITGKFSVWLKTQTPMVKVNIILNITQKEYDDLSDFLNHPEKYVFGYVENPPPIISRKVCSAIMELELTECG